MNILVIAAHPDDEVLGPGGTIVKHVAKGNNVYVCILCESATARSNRPPLKKFKNQVKKAINLLGIKDTMFFDFPNIEMNTMPTLKIVRSMEKAITKFEPEIIYTHHWGDINEDHRITFDATIAAARLPERGNASHLPRNLIKKILCYEVPSSTEWAPPISGRVFMPNVFIDIKDTLDRKIEAIEAYGHITKSYPHPRSIEAIKTYAKSRGIQVGLEYAEAFELLRDISFL